MQKWEHLVLIRVRDNKKRAVLKSGSKDNRKKDSGFNNQEENINDVNNLLYLMEQDGWEFVSVASIPDNSDAYPTNNHFKSEGLSTAEKWEFKRPKVELKKNTEEFILSQDK